MYDLGLLLNTEWEADFELVQQGPYCPPPIPAK